jgi:hypothetical protein
MEHAQNDQFTRACRGQTVGLIQNVAEDMVVTGRDS